MNKSLTHQFHIPCICHWVNKLIHHFVASSALDER
uniref:Uncharacterized protein n=1 Tax=Arundo donax TaxID=35708 RepID=A0A0A8ZQF9_ARUDO